MKMANAMMQRPVGIDDNDGSTVRGSEASRVPRPERGRINRYQLFVTSLVGLRHVAFRNQVNGKAA